MTANMTEGDSMPKSKKPSGMFIVYKDCFTD